MHMYICILPEKGGTKARVHVVNSRRGRVKCRSDRFCRLRIAFMAHKSGAGRAWEGSKWFPRVLWERFGKAKNEA